MKRKCSKCGRSRCASMFRVDFRKNGPQYDSRCDDCRKIAYISRNFAITPDEYIRIMKKSGFRCDICKSKETTARGGRMTLDHDHETGKLRGVLCHACNCAIHRFTTVATLKEAARYLSRFGGSVAVSVADRKRLQNFAEMKKSRKKIPYPPLLA